MSIEQHKALAREFFTRFSASDIPGALDLTADDLVWWSAGKAELMPIHGVRNKERIERVFNGMLTQLKDGLDMTVLSMIAEGDTVAVTVESHGELHNGRLYNNEYHFLMTLRDGKICAVREYYDTQHVHATWFQT